MEKPRTFRPLGTVMAGTAGGVLLGILCLGTWIALGPEVRAQFTTFQRSTLVFVGILGVLLVHAVVRCRVTASTSGLVVVNGYRKHAYEWAEVLSISLRRGAPFATIDLADGTSISAFGIQGSDGSRATRAVQEIRALIESETPDPS